MFSEIKRRAKRLLRRQEPTLVAFFVALPDPLPFPDGAIYSFTYLDTHVPELEGVHVAQQVGGESVEWRGEIFSSLRFWRHPSGRILWEEREEAPFHVMKRVAPELVPDESRMVDDGALPHIAGAYVTVVEAVTVLLPDVDEPMTVAFERCFELIDGVVSAYRLHSGELIPSLTRQRLPALIPYSTRPFRGQPGWTGLSLFMLHMNVGPVGGDELTEPELDVFNLLFEAVSRGHPFALFSERSLDARQSVEREGRFGDAIVSAQTSVEVLLDAVLALMLWEEGKTPEQAASAEFGDAGFDKRVRTHFHGRLGGVWTTSGPGVMAEWASDVARMRGRVVTRVTDRRLRRHATPWMSLPGSRHL